MQTSEGHGGWLSRKATHYGLLLMQRRLDAVVQCGMLSFLPIDRRRAKAGRFGVGFLPLCSCCERTNFTSKLQLQKAKGKAMSPARCDRSMSRMETDATVLENSLERPCKSRSFR